MEARQGREFWRKLVRAYERSGLQQRPFCERHELKLGTFQYWLYKVRRETAPTSTALVRLQVPEPGPATTLMEASLPHGVVLRFACGTDPRYVARLVTEMETSPC